MTKKIILLSVVFCCMLSAKAQEASVETSTFGIQTGFMGVWAHAENKLSASIALRTELGFDSVLGAGSFNNKIDFLIIPSISLEPRWYYNLKKRAASSKKIEGNSGNFLSLKSSYHPERFVISNHDNFEITQQFSLIPTWGIRRNVGRHLQYEAGMGIGYRYFFGDQAGIISNGGEVALNLHLRLGYRL